MGEWKYSYTHWHPQRYMQVSDQLHALAALP